MYRAETVLEVSSGNGQIAGKKLMLAYLFIKNHQFHFSGVNSRSVGKKPIEKKGCSSTLHSMLVEKNDGTKTIPNNSANNHWSAGTGPWASTAKMVGQSTLSQK